MSSYPICDEFVDNLDYDESKDYDKYPMRRPWFYVPPPSPPPRSEEPEAPAVVLRKDDNGHTLCSGKTQSGFKCKNKTSGDGELCHVHLKKKKNTYIGRGIPSY
ncbi:hypothetical protein N9C10_04395 [Flavobacteriaceae bacterium]|nr:hypothetical protein [Flavobacteriaceae bacterium]